MSFLTLSHELIVEIASYLRPQDLAALMVSCRQFRDVVDGSLLLQYIYRTGLAGVYDPLCDLSTRSVADRMETLRRWEASWTNLERYLATPRLVISTDRDVFSPCFLSNEYLFFSSQGDFASLRQPALLYVDLRDALRTGKYLWKQIDYPRGSIWVSQAFSIEEDDLVVSALSFPSNLRWRTILKFMSLETGGTHPLAKEPDIQLDTALAISLHNVRMDIIGDQIVLVLANLYNADGTESDYIYLVDWKQGRMTLVHRAPNGTYEGTLAVLSSDLVLLLRHNPPTIDLCRVIGPSSSPRDGSSSSNHDGTLAPTPDATPSLRVVRTLAIPSSSFHFYLSTAYMETDRYIESRREPEVFSQERECVQAVRAPAPLPFHSAPEDRVVVITFVMNPIYPISSPKKVVMTISHRALFALAAEGPPDCSQQVPDRSAGDCAGCKESEVIGTIEQKQEIILPWEEWGPQAACIFTPSFGPLDAIHAGQRWLSLESDKLVIRDFSAARVRRARTHVRSQYAHASAHTHEDNNGRQGENAVVICETIISGGSESFFKDDVVSRLPFLETRHGIDVHEGANDVILTEGKRLVIVKRLNVGQPVTFDVHVLGDESLTENAEPPCSSTHVPSRM